MNIIKRGSLTAFLLTASAILYCSGSLAAQTPAPSPASSPGTIGGYEVSSSVEFGVRGIDVNGSHEKYRSDLNYRPGFRVFDSSFFVEDRKGGGAFDSALITTTGFGSDPSGSFRLNVEKTGLYKIDSNVRRVKYHYFLNNHAAPEPFIGGMPMGQHNFKTEHTFGDIDLTIFPESPNFRLRFGYSGNDTGGRGSTTTRFQSDEFDVLSEVDAGSQDVRFGVDGRILGFNLGLTYGRRWFSDDTRYFQGPSLGNAVAANTASISSFERLYPIQGTTDFVLFHTQRTFAKRVDFTGRFIYSLSQTDYTLDERYVGLGSTSATAGTPYFIDLNQIQMAGDASRPQARADIGATFRVTDKLRISDTFTFDQFSIGGGSTYFETTIRRTSAGVPNSPAPTSTLYHRNTSYRRFSNLLDVDYQVNSKFGFNVGWRFTDRNVRLEGFQVNRLNSAISGVFDDEHENQTHTLIAGGRVKPRRNWSIFADVEIGDSDNVFTRLANNEVRNFRIRSRTSFNRWAFNLSAIWRDNDTPGRSGGGAVQPFASIVETSNRMISASIDWTPNDNWGISGGYTYQNLTSRADILVPISGQYRRGLSEFFIRNNHFFFDVTARPIDRVSIFASYRIDDDGGQGDRIPTRPEDIITGYPIRFQSPEVRVAIRLNKYMDWNVGYQYYNYKETQPDLAFRSFEQNYNAHLPYTSLRIYFGRSTDR